MAWTTPRTWVTSEVITAALLNAHVRDNEQYLYDALSAIGVWQTISDTPSYLAADSPTFTMTVSSDATQTYNVGGRMRMKQGGSYKYFIIVAVSATVLTLYGGTDYTLTNTAITDVYYSEAKAPLGFPTDPAKWTVTATDSSDRSTTSPVSGTWYNLGSVSISVPIGAWNSWYGAGAYLNMGGGTTATSWLATLSSSASAESSSVFTSPAGVAELANTNRSAFFSKLAPLTVIVKTPYYMNMKATGGTVSSMAFMNATYTPATIRLVCAYL